MATWKEISLDDLAAAKELLAAGHWRSSVSRCYFAVYARITAELVGRVVFRPGYEAPIHAALPDNARDFLSRLAYPRRLRVSEAVEMLYVMRLEADYQASVEIGRDFAVEALSTGQLVFDVLQEGDAHDPNTSPAPAT